MKSYCLLGATLGHSFALLLAAARVIGFSNRKDHKEAQRT